MKKTVILMGAALLALIACHKNEVTPVQQEEVRFSTNLQSYTVKATDTAFEESDEVGIFAGAPISRDNVKAVVSGTSLTVEDPIKWVPGSEEAVTFVAYAPFVEAATQALPFSVATDQSGEASYKASDLLRAVAVSAPTASPVALEFRHALSKVVLTLDNQVADVTVDKVEFVGVAVSGTVDLASGVISGLGDAATIVPFATGTDYQLLLMPQVAQPKVKVTLSNGNVYTFELAQSVAFAAGKKAAATLTLSQQDVEGDPVAFSFSVVDWEADDALKFEEPTVEAGQWQIVGLGNEWGKGIVMTQTETGSDIYGGVWEADMDFTEGDVFKLRFGDTWTRNAGMNPSWSFYALGEFESGDGYLWGGDASVNIVLGTATDDGFTPAPTGSYHVKFTYTGHILIVTANS